WALLSARASTRPPRCASSGSTRISHAGPRCSTTGAGRACSRSPRSRSALAPDALPRIVVDAVVANILAAPLVELAPRFAAHVRPRGTVVLSGILERQVERVAAAYEPYFDG